MTNKTDPISNLSDDYLHQRVLWRLLAVLLVVMLPHAGHVPLWLALSALVVVIWRGWAALHAKAMPPSWLKTTLALAAFAGVYASFGRISGQHAGVALLLLLTALKLTEMRARRDVMVVVFLLYFLLVTHFFFSQEIWTAFYLLLASILITAILIEASHAGRPLPPKVSLKLAGKFILHSLPLMVLMFVLFPRLPGPLWGLPNDAGSGKTGLSNSMSPGDLSQLIGSDEIAFRVKFLSKPPANNQRYWRGPVFWTFDGRRWTPGSRPATAPPPRWQATSDLIRYEITLEPHRERWLFALDLPHDLPANTGLDEDGELLNNQPLYDRKLFTLSSASQNQWLSDLHPDARRRLLALPLNRNPQAVAYGQQLRTQYPDDAALIQAVLKQFNQQNFVYTLEPPKLGNEPVDGFLFDTKRGFCEHYASAFVVLMRAAGIPARVVTGYQGGERNALGDYYIVRQSDAHAWAEVWVPQAGGYGWQRVDPTAAVAPMRVEQSIGQALTASTGLTTYMAARTANRVRYQLEARWDWANSQWNRWVLAYGSDLQFDLLRRFGLESYRDMALTLLAAVSLLLAVMGGWLLWQSRKLISQDPYQREWQKLLKKLAKKGFVPDVGEGEKAFIERLPHDPLLQEALSAYLAGRYYQDHQQLKRLQQAVKAWVKG
jgi:transglutaminase-like putative cysteine protease